MSELALKLENISKMYRLGQVGTGTLSHDLNRIWAKLVGREDPTSGVGTVNDREIAGGDYVWALRDINLEVRQGEILGIIGRNGAGKSTLLKLLSRVTGPTTGSIYVNGRMASLLEVGTGFHPELTGRENIYLNGAILGMKRNEVSARFDEIIDFSGCAKYIDTPVKRYSSGMYVRLAFAVAAHLETDILIVDEVLAVGDAEFQKKCIGKMRDVSTNTNRTVLFVSHNMTSVKKLCPHAILMDRGTLINSGETTSVVEEYLISGVEADRCVSWRRDDAPAGYGVTLRGIYVKDAKGRTCGALTSADEIHLAIEYELAVEKWDMRVGLRLVNGEGTVVFSSSDYAASGSGRARPPGRYISAVTIPSNLLQVGRYVLEVSIEIPRLQVLVSDHSCSFEISEIVHDNYGPSVMARLPGVIHPALQWRIESL